LQAGTCVPSSISIVIEGLVLFVAALSFAVPNRNSATVEAGRADGRAAPKPRLQGLRP
jgi:hypothetical protein